MSIRLSFTRLLIVNNCNASYWIFLQMPIWTNCFVHKNSRTQEMLLGREKARVKNRPNHASWLRIHAIKLEPGVYIVTVGAIKLTATMQERQHTLDELKKMDSVRTFLLNENIFDAEGLADYLDTQS